MDGLMQRVPLSIVDIFEHAERMHSHKEIITRGPSPSRYTYADWAQRVRQLGTALNELGLSADARVGTFCWNHAQHLELYFAAPCSGRVLHTLNIRLFPEQLEYIINHADDEVIFADRSLLPLLLPILEKTPGVRQVVVIDDGSGPEVVDGEKFLDYEQLIAGREPARFVIEDENQAAAMCYTSGTTGNPKGVVYSHRSTYLHAMLMTSTVTISLAEDDRPLVIVPMFHANAWGMPYAAPLCGASLVFPASDMSPAANAQTIQDEKVTIAMGVPTIWQGLLPILERYDLSSLRALCAGGSAVPRGLIKEYRDRAGLHIYQGWGMTETSPIGTMGRSGASEQALDPDAQLDLAATGGYIVPGVTARIVEPDTENVQPWDDEATGELQIKGAWIASEYYKPEKPGLSTTGGWMRTGDIAAIGPRGVLRIVDRTKDLVKSGGEWISSVDVENILMAHPDIKEAAIVGIPHPKWTERPLACVVLKDGVAATEAKKQEILEFLAPQIAKWWMPDALEFIDEVPKTSVGKFSKKDLRQRFADYALPGSEA
ncbi:MAG: long-chain fatty acid--CoA ligase [Cumulibacter sp.]